MAFFCVNEPSWNKYFYLPLRAQCIQSDIKTNHKIDIKRSNYLNDKHVYASSGRWLWCYGATVMSICQCILSLSQLVPVFIRCKSPFISEVSHSIIKGMLIDLWSPMRVFVVIHLQMVCSVLIVVDEILFVFFVHPLATRSLYFCDVMILVA
jgi:hypothetical protein